MRECGADAGVSQVGYGAAAVLSACIAVNVTMTPALLLACPRFYRWRYRGTCCRRDGTAARANVAMPLLAGAPAAEGLWFRIARWVTARPCLVIVGIVVAGSPVSYYASQFRTTIDQNQIHPRNTEVFATWLRYKATFPSGFSWPYALIMKVTCAAGRARGCACA